MTDARNGTTSYAYNAADLVTSVTTPAPGPGSAPQTTTTYYNSMLQATNVVQPDGTSVNSSYLPTGELGHQYGSRTYPVGYSYDYAGRTKTMTNWSGFSGNSGARVTTWHYDPQRGWLTGKQYPLPSGEGRGQGPSYYSTAATVHSSFVVAVSQARRACVSKPTVAGGGGATLGSARPTAINLNEVASDCA